MFKYDYIAYIGRFQMAHLGHYEMLKQALTLAEKVVVIVGSSFGARTPKNPMKYAEVVEMIKTYFSKKEKARFIFVPQPDLGDDTLWVSAVNDKIRKVVGKKSCGLLSHIKDDSGYYQKLFPTYPLEPQPLYHEGLSATTIRAAVLDPNLSIEETQQMIAPYLGKKALAYISKWMVKSFVLGIMADAKEYADYKAIFKNLPYPPTFNTSDSVITCVHKGVKKVLLIKRGQAPGEGCWAFPGGFLNQNDTYLQAAIRETEEETKYDSKKLQAYFVSAKTFDYPFRSLRGRVITVAHHFDLGEVDKLPRVKGSDDAQRAVWKSLEFCVKHCDEFFEDHFWGIFMHFFKPDLSHIHT